MMLFCSAVKPVERIKFKLMALILAFVALADNSSSLSEVNKVLICACKFSKLVWLVTSPAPVYS